MATPQPRPALIPAAEPEALRTALVPALRAEFDTEWDLVLDQAKCTKSLEGIHALLAKWQHTAVLEQRDPGSYCRILDKVDQIQAKGGNPEGRTLDEMLAAIEERRRQAS
ncbi:DUF6247 family protein [Nocardia sp. NBC_00511]|uniref:DUF6247 family protein n=1 Tax=Nocardia sp. NBC_00511 TaxID=2903591 RepID=UPI0030DECBC6